MSLFDKPKRQLCPVLFDKNERLKSEVRMYIFNDIDKIFQPRSITNIFLLGSTAGRQYNDQSDIDINLVLRPGLERNDIKEYVKTFNGRFLPGTAHPINYFVQNYNVPKYEDIEYAVYDILNNKWVVPPKRYEEIRNPEEEFRDEIEYAEMYSDIITPTNKDRILKLLEKDRKMAYGFGWGTPRESQQNILYKYLHKILDKPNEN